MDRGEYRRHKAIEFHTQVKARFAEPILRSDIELDLFLTNGER